MNDDGSKNLIACIGWGSLVYNPGGLGCRGDWNFDGPLLPVEFARQSAGNRITLVLCPEVPRVRTCWTLLDTLDIVSARQSLGVREYAEATPSWISANVGYWERATDTSSGLEAAAIANWGKERGLAGVVWTSLPCKFGQTTGVMPSAEQVIGYLGKLQGDARSNAEAYVRKVPEQIDTPYRRLIAKEFGWTFLS